ncbi:MAG: hypothetical protein CMH66_03810 [Nioella sp.]|nr:hypothetical protein [Nioella sp.]|tara:strand:- start:295 stop:585 length:291 start_codon:yes stop_codon:yes gene_type:complete
MAIQIDCIEKRDRFDPSEAIVSIGGRNADGTRWKLSQNEAIAGIKSGKWDFFVSANGRRTKVIVAVSRFGNDYIKTEADDYEPNNLLSLRSCSIAA